MDQAGNPTIEHRSPVESRRLAAARTPPAFTYPIDEPSVAAFPPFGAPHNGKLRSPRASPLGHRDDLSRLLSLTTEGLFGFGHEPWLSHSFLSNEIVLVFSYVHPILFHVLDKALQRFDNVGWAHSRSRQNNQLVAQGIFFDFLVPFSLGFVTSRDTLASLADRSSAHSW
jgi:hypothetical protein